MFVSLSLSTIISIYLPTFLETLHLFRTLQLLEHTTPWESAQLGNLLNQSISQLSLMNGNDYCLMGMVILLDWDTFTWFSSTEVSKHVFISLRCYPSTMEGQQPWEKLEVTPALGALPWRERRFSDLESGNLWSIQQQKWCWWRESESLCGGETNRRKNFLMGKKVRKTLKTQAYQERQTK